jgi:hypothetical protein
MPQRHFAAMQEFVAQLTNCYQVLLGSGSPASLEVVCLVEVLRKSPLGIRPPPEVVSLAPDRFAPLAGCVSIEREIRLGLVRLPSGRGCGRIHGVTFPYYRVSGDIRRPLAPSGGRHTLLYHSKLP